MALQSKEYWRIREQQHAKEMLARDQLYADKIQIIYDRNYREIERTINDFYTRYANKNGLSLADAKEKVSSFDVQAYADKAKQWVQERNFSKEANEALELYNATMRINRLELLKSEIGMYLVNTGDELNKYIYDTLTDEAKAEALRQAGILGETLKTMSPEDIDKVVKGSHKVDISNTAGQSTFSERIWGHNQTLKSNLDNLLTQSLINGKHPNVLARDLMKQFNASRYEAERLMRTESARVQGAVQLENATENGYDYYEIVASPGCCSACAAMDGKVFRISDAEIGTNMYPFHPNCRCSAAVSMGKERQIESVYDTDSIEKMRDILYNKKRYTEQFNRYKAVLKDLVPDNYEAFAGIRYDDPKKWEDIKHKYRIVNQYKIDSGSMTPQEIFDFDKRIITEKRKLFTSDFRRSGNIGGVYVDENVDKLILAHSNIGNNEPIMGYRGKYEIAAIPKKSRYTASRVKMKNGAIRYGTDCDSEYKLFECLAEMYDTKPFKTVHMLSERGMCDSCKSVMAQFKKDHPDVTVNVISNKDVERNVWKHRMRGGKK